MKTIKQITRKYDSLLAAFRKERDTTCYENMGNRYLQKFDEYVGNEFSYSHGDRMEIIRLSKALFDAVTR